MTTELTPQQQKAISIREWLNGPGVVKQLEAALPKFLTSERFLRTFYTAILRNEKLLDCTKESMLSAMITSAQLGLEPVLNKAALIPYGKEVQFQPMYKGLMDLARRADNVKIIPHVVYSKDDFEVSYGLEERLVHVPKLDGDRGEALGAYVVWTREDGLQSFYFMSMADINKVRDKFAKAYLYAIANPKNEKAQDTPWITSPSAMAKKTVIKMSSKYEPSSHELATAVELDNLAEAGKSQRHLLAMMQAEGVGVTFPATGEPGEEHPEDGATGESEDFKVLAGRFDRELENIVEYNVEALQTYLELALKGAAKKEERAVSMEELKASIMEIGFKTFWTSFEKWCADLKAKKAGKQEPSKDDAALIAEIKRASRDRLISWIKTHPAETLSAEVQKAYSEKWAKYQEKEGKGQPDTGGNEPPETEGKEEIEPDERYPIRCHNKQVAMETVKQYYCETGCRYREDANGAVVCNDYYTYMEKAGLLESEA